MKKTARITFFAMAALLAAHTLLAQAGSVNTSGTGTAGVVISSTSGYPDVDVKTGTTSGSALRVFNSGNTELLRVSANGNVGVGTAAPSAKLHVAGGSLRVRNAGEIFLDVSSTNPVLYLTGGDANSYYPSLMYVGDTGILGSLYAYKGNGMILSSASGLYVMLSPGGTESLRALANGNIGIGMTTPTQRVEVSGKLRIIGTQNATMAGNSTDYYGGGRQAVYGTVIYGTSEGDGAAYTYGVPNSESTYYVGGKAGAYIKGGNGWYYAGGGAGVVAIGGDALNAGGSSSEGGAGIYARGGLNASGGGRAYAGYFAGDVVVTGNIGAKYQDVAEWVPAAEKLSAGTVVVLDAKHSNQVTPSHRAYDTAVAGVVSAQPGLILGEAGDTKAMVATTGRVKVRVDATKQSIAIGDLLVTSTKPGVAMKSIPVDVQGISLPRPGTVVGKALEPLAGGEGEILVLLSLQ